MNLLRGKTGFSSLRSFTTSRYVSNEAKKPFYITTPIFYVNAAPHLGHLYSMLLCDVRNRWELLNNRPSFFTTGTDEHGLKVQEAAEKNGKDPQEFVNNVCVTFQKLADQSNVKADRFIRTTNRDHRIVVTKFWEIVKEKGYIYEGQHQGWYSVSDETFYPESQIEEKVDSKTGSKQMISSETGTEVIYQKETNYFFKMSVFYNDLMKLLNENSEFILPQSRQLELMKELQLKGKLEDLSISRPSSRLKWGIPVPGDDSQTIYVWFDALVNYLTSAGAENWISKSNPIESPWPATHLIGKDIVKFHAVYWPCFLMAAGIEVPKQLIVHGHWLCEGVKMSKSLGNVVDPIDIMNYYGTDPVRFFLCENSVLEGDCDFNEERLYNSRNNIMGKLANLIMRSCGPNFDIQRAIKSNKKLSEEQIQEILKSFNLSEILESYNRLKKDLEVLPGKISNNFETFQMIKVIDEIMKIVVQSNQLFQIAEPWTLKNDLQKQDLIIYLCIETARISSILLKPIIPELSDKFLDRISVDKDKRDINFVAINSDDSYGGNCNKKGDPPMSKIKPRT